MTGNKCSKEPVISVIRILPVTGALNDGRKQCGHSKTTKSGIKSAPPPGIKRNHDFSIDISG